jgi:hypothetical protein
MASAIVTNNFRDVSHLPKFNGQNFTDWRYEFQSMMEQLGLNVLLEAPPGGHTRGYPNGGIDIIVKYFHIVYN